MQYVMTPRERATRTAFDRLGPVRVRAFLEAIRGGGPCLAVELITQDLDAGATPEVIFLTGEERDFYLHVKGRGRKFRIEFGCVPGPMVGDGGEWNLEFDKDGKVVRCEIDTLWRS